MELYSHIMKSPIGNLTLVASAQGLTAVLWPKDAVGRVKFPKPPVPGMNEHLQQAAQELSEYFRGERTEFRVKLDPYGTEFQKLVWQELSRIPFGETRSYGQLALQIRKPTAARAVGAANGRNPLSIIVPCHRVIGASGALTGFAGGLEAKAFLLKLEGRS